MGFGQPHGAPGSSRACFPVPVQHCCHFATPQRSGPGSRSRGRLVPSLAQVGRGRLRTTAPSSSRAALGGAMKRPFSVTMHFLCGCGNVRGPPAP